MEGKISPEVQKAVDDGTLTAVYSDGGMAFILNSEGEVIAMGRDLKARVTGDFVEDPKEKISEDDLTILMESHVGKTERPFLTSGTSIVMTLCLWAILVAVTGKFIQWLVW